MAEACSLRQVCSIVGRQGSSKVARRPGLELDNDHSQRSNEIKLNILAEPLGITLDEVNIDAIVPC